MKAIIAFLIGMMLAALILLPWATRAMGEEFTIYLDSGKSYNEQMAEALAKEKEQIKEIKQRVKHCIDENRPAGACRMTPQEADLIWRSRSR